MNREGDFIWYELLANDVAQVAPFYSRIFGWRVRDAGGAVAGYHEFSTPQTAVGGMMAISADMAHGGARPAWIGYVAVTDVDATLGRWESAGGKVLMPVRDLPGIGRLAMVADPAGVPLYVMHGAVPGTSTAFAVEGIGHCNWNQLATPDPAAAFGFFGAVFGWKAGDVLPMGPAGDYTFIVQGDVPIGGVMKPFGPVPPHWTFFFGVGDIDAAARGVEEGGGKLLSGPDEVPDGGFTIVAADPQGAVFGAVGPRIGPAAG
jgi:uncharacterized protein